MLSAKTFRYCLKVYNSYAETVEPTEKAIPSKAKEMIIALNDKHHIYNPQILSSILKLFENSRCNIILNTTFQAKNS